MNKKQSIDKKIKENDSLKKKEITKETGKKTEKKETEIETKKETEKEKESPEKKYTNGELIENIIAFGIIIIIIIGFSGLIGGWFNFGTKVVNTPNTINKVNPGYKPRLGMDNATIMMIEFSNYKCSHCRDFSINTLPLIKEKYISTGKVQFAYRDFVNPSVSSMGLKTAGAATCAQNQGKFWEYNELLYKNQDKIDDVFIRKLAKNIGLDEKAFENCLNSPNTIQAIANDYKDGENLGITGTPTFFINGKKVVGAKSFEEFGKIIDEEIINATKPINTTNNKRD